MNQSLANCVAAQLVAVLHLFLQFQIATYPVPNVVELVSVLAPNLKIEPCVEAEERRVRTSLVVRFHIKKFTTGQRARIQTFACARAQNSHSLALRLSYMVDADIFRVLHMPELLHEESLASVKAPKPAHKYKRQQP